MKPILYAPDETNFTTNGLGALSDAISVIVEEERNGKFELTIKYPFDGIHFSDVKHSSIIKAKPHDNGNDQLFRVYKITSPLNKQCTIYAEHISYQLNYIPLMPFTAYDIQSALYGITQNMAEPCPFTFWSDIQSAAVYEQHEPEMVRTRLGGQEGSFLDTYGGEFEWDNYTVKLWEQRGMDRDVTLRYGKNITDIQQEESIANTITGIVPYWIGDVIDDEAKEELEEIIESLEGSTESLTDQITAQQTKVNRAKTAYNNAKNTYGANSSQAKKKKKAWNNQKQILAKLKEGKSNAEAELTQRQEELRSVEGTRFETMVSLPEKVIYVADADEFPFHRIRAVDLSDKFEEKPTVAELRDMAESWMDANCVGEPEINLKVSFVALWDTDEYKDIAPLESVQLCDTVVVEFERLGIRVAAKVTQYKYNVLLERYESITLGDAKKTLAGAVSDNHNLMLDVINQVPTTSTMQAEIDRATKLINGGYGGYVVFVPNANGQPEEILIMDDDDINEATNVIRINKNGIGFSTSGYAGPYRTAWTIDSHFVADFITAGELNANVIHAGILTDYHNATWAVTADTTVKAGKGYYTRWNDGTTESPKWVYQLVSNPIGNPHALGYYECTHPANTNFWNLNTGEFQLMSTVKVGNETLEQFVEDHSTELTQENVFNALTQNGTKQGIIMDSSGNLYINASYIQGGTIVGSTIKFQSSSTSQAVQLSNGAFQTVWNSILTGEIYPLPVTSSSNRKGIGIQGVDFVNIQTQSSSGDINLGNSGQYVYSMAIHGYSPNDNAANVRCGDYGIMFRRSSSSRRYKHDIKDIEEPLNPKKLYDLPVHQFVYNLDYISKASQHYGQPVPGLIAEEVEEIYPVACDYENGMPEDWNERYIIPPMLALIQEQHKEIESLKAEVSELKLQMQEILAKIGE